LQVSQVSQVLKVLQVLQEEFIKFGCHKTQLVGSFEEFLRRLQKSLSEEIFPTNTKVFGRQEVWRNKFGGDKF
jgi:hypothetical protein